MTIAQLNICLQLNAGSGGLAYCCCLLAGVGINAVAPLSSADRVVAYYMPVGSEIVIIKSCILFIITIPDLESWGLKETVRQVIR
jgi:hypothetical protein